jgi:hypothetical protein
MIVLVNLTISQLRNLLSIRYIKKVHANYKRNTFATQREDK